MDEVLQAIKDLSAKYVFDPKLIWAFCKQESNLETNAGRFEPEWRYVANVSTYIGPRYSFDTETHLQMFSYGLMQIMGTNIREYGYKGHLQDMWSDWKSCLEYSLIHLNHLRARYPLQDNMIAAWNAGSPTLVANGRYFNQNYVDSVNYFYKNCTITF